MKSKTSTAMVLLVLIVVILSVALTWSALNYSEKINAKIAAEYSAKEAPISGLVGINMQPKEGVQNAVK